MLGACASPAERPAPARPAAAPAKSERERALAVYDAAGRERHCEPPREQCTDTPLDPDFLERCVLAGYRVMRCGCEKLCSGKAAESKRYYDAAGKQLECAPEQASCVPPDTSATFQDACTDAGHKLIVCGCRWLCDGQPKPGF